MFYSATIENQGAASFCIPIKGTRDLFVVGLKYCACIVRWNGRSSNAFKINDLFCVDVQPDFKNHTINFGRTDPTGRLYVSTFKNTYCNESFPSDCSLYSYDKSGDVQQQIGGIRVSAGMAWNKNNHNFYHINVCEKSLKKYNWNTGELLGKQ